MRLVKAAKAFPHAKFYNLSTAYYQQTVKPRKFKFGLNIVIKKSVMCANFGNPRLRDRELRHKKTVISGFKSY